MNISADKQNKNDFKFLLIYEICLNLYVFSSLIAIFRVLGYGSIFSNINIIIARLLDIIIIFSYFILLENKIKIRNFDKILSIVCIYPLIIGIVSNNLNLTLINDFLIFSLFLLKVLAVRSTIERLSIYTNLEVIFQNIFKRIFKVCILTSIIGILFINLFSLIRTDFYYQSVTELTLPYAFTLLNNYNFGSTFIIILSLLSGKRMIFLSYIFILVNYLLFFKKQNISQYILKIFIYIIPISILLIIFLNYFLDERILDKYTFIFKRFNLARDLSIFSDTNYLDVLLSSVIPNRYLEIKSVLNNVSDSFSFFFGKGFGFRYDVITENNLINELGLVKEESGINITNAHFTPIAIILKFGLLGFLSWTILLINNIKKVFQKQTLSYVKIALLALIGFIFQSFFAFGFFMNIFTPFLVGLISANTQFNENHSPK